MTQNALFLCGSLNQTTMMHKISACMPEFDCYFSPFYVDSDSGLNFLRQLGLLNHTILAGQHRKATLRYLRRERLAIDKTGASRPYDIVVTCTDLIIQKNIRNRRLLLVQEGITEQEDFIYELVRRFKLPRFLANTSMTGLSDDYDLFCVASSGYRDLFRRKGVNPDKIVVTGIPNFDNVAELRKNDFPERDFVLVATSAIRETGKLDNRTGFLERVRDLAAGRRILFKLHPNENHKRAEKEIRRYFPDAPIYREGNVDHMIANCSLLITQVSSCVYTGINLGKEVYSYFDINELKKLAPIQNGGTSAEKIADICRYLVTIPIEELRQRPGVAPAAGSGRWRRLRQQQAHEA